jgi:RNA polymerase sigma factor (sigma-70 family)
METSATRPTPDQLAAEHGTELAYELHRGFAGRLIRRKARQLVGKARIADGDRDDIEQELRIALLQRIGRFDPQRAPWPAFVLAVIDRRVASLLKARRAKKRKHRENLLSLSSLVPGEEGMPTELGDTILPRHQEFLVGAILNDHQSAFALADDLAVVLAGLPPRLQQLCELRRTMSVTEISQYLGVPRSTVVYWFSKIAAALTQGDLQNYLAGDP